MPTEFAVPILLIVFNRLETTKRVFAAIRERRPRYLFIAGDGPRPEQAGEDQACQAVRHFIQGQIDWPCEVKTLWHDHNQGCRRAVSSAINWFFENVAEGIILEDDCLPAPDFFIFSQELLARYRDVAEVYMISGDNFLPPSRRPTDSYYFSRLTHIWGWATWRRAWTKYDLAMSDFPVFRKEGTIAEIWTDPKTQSYWLDCFQEVATGRLDTWDYQWIYTIWKNKGWVVAPRVNLVSNIGFRSGTHTWRNYNRSAGVPTEKIAWPLSHPVMFQNYPAWDQYENQRLYLKNYGFRKLLKTLGLFTPLKNIYRYVMQNLSAGK